MASVVFTIGSVVMAVSPNKYVKEQFGKKVNFETKYVGASGRQDCGGDGNWNGEYVHPCLHGRDQPGGAEGLPGGLFPGRVLSRGDF